MDKELAKFVKALEAQGFTVRATKKGHQFVTREGKPVTTLSGTPSDHRSWQNSLSAAKRAGFKWPPVKRPESEPTN